MDPYLAAVSDSDLVVISEYAGHVGKGVAEEVAQAVRNGIPAVVLRPAPPGTAPAGEFGWHVTPVGGVVVEDRNDWKVRYALLATAGAAVPAEEWFSEWLARHHDPDDTAVEFSTGGPVQFDPREGDD
jgi:L-asparaginase/Glu-tRNA(Gln) amidotransferase subunit D